VDRLKISGEITVGIYELDGTLVDLQRSKNLVLTAGLSAMAAALMWSAMIDQNANQGLPFNPITLAPIYGAVGSASVAATSTDTQLGAELARSICGAASYNGATFSLLFNMGITVGTWTIWEGGVFASATPESPPDPDSSGILLNHSILVSAVTKAPTQTAVFQASFGLWPG
jgi:hypothetical protein